MVMRVMNARFWIGVLVVAAAIICVFALTLSTPGADAGAPVPETESGKPAQGVALNAQTLNTQTYEGIITDTHCGAKHSAAVGLSAADCTRACVHSGEHFALVDGDKMYILAGDDAALKRAAGERVKITGTLNGKTISVQSVIAAAS